MVVTSCSWSRPGQPGGRQPALLTTRFGVDRKTGDRTGAAVVLVPFSLGPVVAGQARLARHHRGAVVRQPRVTSIFWVLCCSSRSGIGARTSSTPSV